MRLSLAIPTCLPSVILAIALGVGVPTLVGAAPVKAPRAPAAAVAATRFSIEMALVERTGSTIAERNVDVALGVTETTTVERKPRTVVVETTVTAGNKPGCYKINLVVRDRNIDATGHFAKTVWQSATEPCDSQPITLGPKDEIQVRVAVKPKV